MILLHRLALAAASMLAACAAGLEDSSDDFEVQDQWTEECDTENDPNPEDCEEANARCTSTSQCEEGRRCVADFDPSRAEIGPLVCEATCIDNYDQAQWCVDASSCCDASAICTGRGFCVPSPDQGSSGGESSTDSTGETSTDSGSSSEEGASTQSGGSSSGATESGSSGSESTGGTT